MATTPGSRRRETRTDITGDDRDILNPMQEPLGSMDAPGSRLRDPDDVNLASGEPVRRTGTFGTTSTARPTAPERGGRSFTATFAIVAVIVLAAFLIALSFSRNRSDVATTTGTQSPISDTTNTDTTGSVTKPVQNTAPGTGDAGTGGTTGTTTPPANP